MLEPSVTQIHQPRKIKDRASCADIKGHFVHTVDIKGQHSLVKMTDFYVKKLDIYLYVTYRLGNLTKKNVIFTGSRIIKKMPNECVAYVWTLFH